MVTKGFALINIRQMHLDKRNSHSRQSVANGHTSMRIGSRVNNNELRLIKPCGLDTIDKRPFGIALEKIAMGTLTIGHCKKFGVKHFEGLIAINFRLARAK